MSYELHHSPNSLQNPAGFLFTFTLPVVDADEEESGEEWNIWLNALRVLTVLGLFMSVTRCKFALPHFSKYMYSNINKKKKNH